MTVAVWPASLPQSPQRGNWSGGARDERRRFQPDLGPPIERRGVTAETSLFEAVFPNLDADQLTVFKAFVRDDLAGGVLPFAFRDPITGDVGLWKIMPRGDLTYAITAKGARLHDVGVQMMRLPQPWWADHVPADRIVVPDAVFDFRRGLYHDGTRHRGFGEVLDFSRASVGYAFGAGGLIAASSVDVPRFVHDSSTRARLGLLVEPASTNLCSRSHEFNQWTIWLPASATVTANGYSDWMGGMQSDLLTKAATVSEGALLFSFNPSGSGQPHTISVLASSGGQKWLRLGFAGDGFGGRVTARVNLATGEIVSDAGVIAATVENIPYGWRRVSVSVEALTSGSVFQGYIQSRNDSGTADYAGSGSAGVVLWGCNIEPGLEATSIIPTSGSTATRAADVIGLASAIGTRDVRIVEPGGAVTVLPSQTVGAGYWPGSAPRVIDSMAFFAAGALA